MGLWPRFPLACHIWGVWKCVCKEYRNSCRSWQGQAQLRGKLSEEKVGSEGVGAGPPAWGKASPALGTDRLSKYVFWSILVTLVGPQLPTRSALPTSGPTYKTTPLNSPLCKPSKAELMGLANHQSAASLVSTLIQSAKARVETLGGALPIRVKCLPLVQSLKAGWKHRGIPWRRLGVGRNFWTIQRGICFWVVTLGERIVDRKVKKDCILLSLNNNSNEEEEEKGC